MANELYETIQIYRQTVDTPVEGLPPSDMLSLVMGGSLEDTKNRPQAYNPPLVDGARYGLLTLDRKVKRQSPYGRMYKCKCKCGGAAMLTKRELFSRARMGAGCLEFDCPHGSEELKARHNPTFALKLQLRTLLSTTPREVDDSWGGKAYSLSGDPDREGFTTLCRDILPRVKKAKGNWWLRRKNPILPYALFNVELVDEPAFNVFGEYSEYVWYCDTLFSTGDLASMFSIKKSIIQEWRRDYVSDRKVMELIMKETDK